MIWCVDETRWKKINDLSSVEGSLVTWTKTSLKSDPSKNNENLPMLNLEYSKIYQNVAVGGTFDYLHSGQ
jgi:hypothetical protein